MRHKNRCLRRLLLGLAVFAGTSASAAEPRLTSAEARLLIERLERAESRIDALQHDLQEAQRAQRAQPCPREPRPMPPSSAFETSLIDPAEDALQPAGYATVNLFDDPAEDELAVQLAKLAERQTALEKEQEGLVEKLSKGLVTPGTSNATVRISGRIHADYWAFPGHDAAIDEFEEMDPQDRFIFRRVRFGVQGDIKDNMVYKIEMDFAGGNDPVFKDVYLGFTDLPVLQTVLLGIQKRPYGLDHLNSSRYNVFMERPFVIEGFNQDTRRLGILSYGVSENEAWNWRYGVFNLEDPQTDPGYVGDHYQLEAAGRLAHTYWYDEASDGRCYGHFGLAGTVAHPDGDGGPQNANEARFRARPEARTDERWLNTGRIAGAEWYELLGLEKVINFGPLQIVGEYQNVWLQREAGAGDDLIFWGGYAYVAYMLTGEHVPWDRESGVLGRVKPFKNFFVADSRDGAHAGGWGAWQIAARYSHADFSNRDILGGVGHSMTLGLNWYWNPNAKLQFNYIHGWIDDHAPVNGQTEGEYDIIGMRAAVDF